MFRPEKMSFVNISLLDEYLTNVLDCVTRLGIMHIVDKKELPSTSGMLKDVNVQPVRDKLFELNNRLNVLLDAMEVETKYLPVLSRLEREQIEINPFEIVENIEKELAEIEADVNPVIQQIAQLQAEMNDLDKDSRRLYVLEAHGLKIEDLRSMRFLYFAFGDIPVEFEHYRRLLGSLARVPCVIIKGKIVGKRQQILAFSLIADKEILSNALEGAYFSRIDIPEKYNGSITEVLDTIELEIWTKREEIAELQLKIRSLR